MILMRNNAKATLPRPVEVMANEWEIQSSFADIIRSYGVR